MRDHQKAGGQVTMAEKHSTGAPAFALANMQAKARADALYAASGVASAALQKFPRNGMGLVSDDVRVSPEYRAAKATYERAANELRTFNRWYVKAYRAEIAANRAFERASA
jgi:hypothetical protein